MFKNLLRNYFQSWKLLLFNSGFYILRKIVKSKNIILLLFSVCLPYLAICQGDTAVVSFKKLFKYKPLPFDADYNNKDFKMDSILNTIDKHKYIKYRAEIKTKPDNLKIAKHFWKRFLKLDSISKNEFGDTLHAEFYALGYVGSIKDVLCFIVERQFFDKYYRSSEKFLITYDRRLRQIDKILLTHQIPGAQPPPEFTNYADPDKVIAWFEDTQGMIYEDMTITLANEIGKVTKFRVEKNGKIKKKY